ncbi:HRDC domain-containing protein [Epilithonimonas sp.]|uniref:HRDC domain-containing protein n=1 Tax=Epilithonimonas sp. TaxID=2894511 RepID=UPI0028A98326|nr:HRDC domain-containing protein [Epilithonimonas sp.]
MKVKVLKIRIDDRFQITDEAIVNDYLSRFEIVNMNAKLVADEINYWSVLIYYNDKKNTVISSKTTVNSESELSEEEKIIYNKLKDWRADKAREAQLPAYIIFHNTHLMSIARHKPCTLDDLENVNGIGKSKVEKFGIEILEVLENA